jgi:hypothetical protein
MSEVKSEQPKMARPPLPQPRESHYRTSIGFEKPEKERDHTEYREHSVK